LDQSNHEHEQLQAAVAEEHRQRLELEATFDLRRVPIASENSVADEKTRDF